MEVNNTETESEVMIPVEKLFTKNQSDIYEIEITGEFNELGTNHIDNDIDHLDNLTENVNSPSISKTKEIKKPCTAFFIYLGEMRSKIIQENPGISFKEIPKVCSEKFKNLSTVDRAHYDNLAKSDRERYIKEVELDKLNRKDDPEINLQAAASKSGTELVFPLGRIKRIVKLDKEIKNLSKEALVAITKSTELFIASLTLKTSQITGKRKGKVIKDSDLYQTVFSHEPLHFLRLDTPRERPTTNTPAAKKSNLGLNTTTVDAEAKSIKSFFVSASSNSTN